MSDASQTPKGSKPPKRVLVLFDRDDSPETIAEKLKRIADEREKQRESSKE